MKTDNFKNRYIIKLSSSVGIAIFNVVIQFILPRALSVDEYGFYTYNLNVFTSIVVMANLSTSSAMVSKFAKRNNEIGLIYFYLKFYALMSILLCIGISIVYATEFGRNTFIGQTIVVVMLGQLSALVIKLLSDCISMYDAFAISRFPALMQIILKSVICLVVVAAFAFGMLNLLAFYIIQISVTGVALLVLLLTIIKEQKTLYKSIINKGTAYYAKEYFIYCRPLIVATIISQGITVLMNYSLMHWSGSSEQALFGVAWQINTVIGYIFSPYAELSKREFAVLYREPKQLQIRYIQSLKLVIWMTAYFAVYIGIEADWILPVLFGARYSSAGVVTFLIMYYTVYQAWGQINGAYMLALEKTKLNAMLAVIGQFTTFGFVFLFQTPNFIWPQSLGALGIALNYTVANFVGVTISVCAIAIGLGLKPIKVLTIQVVPITFCTVTALSLRYCMNLLLPDTTIVANMIKILISGIGYTILIWILIRNNSELIGLPKGSASVMMVRLKAFLFKKD